MTTHVALLYSIVIDRKRRVVMSDLRAIAESLGYLNVRSLASTGNLVFEAGEASVSAIEQSLEQAFAAFHGKHVDIIVKTAEDCAASSLPIPSRPRPKRIPTASASA